MNTVQPSADPAEARQFSIPEAGIVESLLGRVDLLAIIITLVGICLLGLVGMVMAVIQLARLIAILWSGSSERWLLITLGAAIVWVLVRWKKSRVG